MKITIEPSLKEPGYSTVSLDTNTNDEGTGEAVEAVLALLKTYGHTDCNIAEAAIACGEEMKRNHTNQP